MAIDKLIPQYLNSDTDQKLVKAVEMTDNLNIRVSNDDEGTAGVIKNIKGTTVVGARRASDAYPSGDNRVIGSVANEQNKEVLFLLWNSNSNHGIYRLDMTTGKYQKLYQDSVLNFKKFSYAECSVVINKDKETLLYFTDNVNPPMKVNINRLILGRYPNSLSSGTDEEKLLSLTVAKQPPLKAPSYVVKNNPNLTGESRIKNNNYQFAYKYIYEDGEHSALSPYSSVSIANSQLVDGLNTDEAKDFFNQIDVFGLNSVADVKKIVFYARRVGGQFFEISEINNSSNTNSVKVEFTDNIIGTFLPETEQNKIYDNVPQKARAQSIAGNRLMYGSYVEGYENISTDVNLLSNHHKNPDLFEINVSLLTGSFESGAARQIEIDYSNVPSIIPIGTGVTSTASKVLLNFFIDFENIYADGVGPQSQIQLTNGDLILNFKTKDDAGNEKFKTINVLQIQGKDVLQAVQSTIDGYLGSGSGFTPAIAFTTEGLHIKEIIDIPANTGLQGIKDLVKSRLVNKDYRMFLNPTDDDRRFSALKDTTGAFSLVTDLFTGQESASFKGTMDMQISYVSSTLQVDKYNVKAKASRVELSVHEISDQSGRDAEIVSSSKFSLPYNKFIFPSATLYEGSCAISESLVGDRSFKSGASHKFGLVYYDDRGRTSGVQELGDVFVKHINDRSGENNLHGKSSIVMRLLHSPPSFAKRWAPVYVGKGNIDLKFQYGVKGAFIPTNNIDRDTSFSSDDNIYISLNSLFNKDSSYTKSSSALINYTYEAGDRLRIVKYDNGLRETEEFEIVDYVTLVNDTKNPILEKIAEKAIDATTGDFLVVKNNEAADGFDYESVISNTSNWFKRCIVEIYRPSKEIEDNVYYEIGKSYSVASGAHEDERTSTGVSVTIETGDDSTSPEVKFHTNVEVFKGDIISQGGVSITIGNVYESDVVSGKYIAHGVSNTTVTAGTYTVQNPEKVINISIGDVYHRARNCFVYNDQIDTLTYSSSSSNNSVVEFIEDYSVSDFFKSKASSIGRPFGYIPDAKNNRRRASITYSDAYLLDSDRLGLSSFNLSLANWKDLELVDGNIQSLINRNEALTVIQQSKASQIPINRNLIEFSSGDANISVSKNVLGNTSYYAGDFGTSNPESVVERFGVVYYVDAEAAKVIRLSADGITPISDKGVSSFLEKKLTNLSTVTDSIRVVGGFDPDNGEYIISVEPVYNRTITVNSELGNIPTDDLGAFTIQGITFVPSTVIWNTIGLNWNGLCGNWNDIGNGIVFVDSAFQAQTILVDQAFASSVATINIIVTDSSFSFVAVATLNLATGVVNLPSTTCDGTSITLGSTTLVEQGFTLAYKHKEGVWGSKYSFKPTSYVNINNELYSFFDTSSGVMWKHNVNETRNNFYGTQYNSEIEVVSNRNPSMIKVFEALGVEGSGSWSGALTTSDQSTTIGTSDFDTREGHRYAMIFKDTLVSTGHQIYLGKVESISNDTITFTTPVNKIPFLVGDTLKTASGATLTDTTMVISTLTGRKTIQCTTTVSNVSVGDNVFVEHASRIDGDPMRDVFLKIKLTSSDTEAFEVHAVSVSYDRSRLHNDRVN